MRSPPLAGPVRNPSIREAAFIDSNVLVYTFDSDEPAKQRTARELLSSHPERWVLSAQVLGEFYVTTTRRLARPLLPEDAAAAVEGFATLRSVPLDAALVGEAISISTEAQLSYWDGLIVAAAARGGCGKLLTEDLNDGQLIAGVRIENPFAA